MAPKKIRKAVFPVAGLGTRFLPATKSIPKEMLTVLDRPLIQYAVEEAKRAGIEEFIFVTGRGKTALEDFFDYSYELNETLKKRGRKEDLEIVNQVVLDPGTVIYTRQQEPLGLGHAVWCARHLVKDEPFAVILADDLILSKAPCLSQMIKAYEDTSSNILALQEVNLSESSNYGMVKAGPSDGNGYCRVDQVVEKPEPEHSPSNLAVVGRYILDGKIFEALDSLKAGRNGEIQLTDAITTLLQKQPFTGVKFEGERFDCGSPPGLIEATIRIALSRPDLAEATRSIIKQMVNKQ